MSSDMIVDPIKLRSSVEFYSRKNHDPMWRELMLENIRVIENSEDEEAVSDALLKINMELEIAAKEETEIVLLKARCESPFRLV